MDVVDHGQGFIDKLMEHVAAQIEKAATEVREGLTRQLISAYSLLCPHTCMIAWPPVQDVPSLALTRR